MLCYAASQSPKLGNLEESRAPRGPLKSLRQPLPLWRGVLSVLSESTVQGCISVRGHARPFWGHPAGEPPPEARSAPTSPSDG